MSEWAFDILKVFRLVWLAMGSVIWGILTFFDILKIITHSHMYPINNDCIVGCFRLFVCVSWNLRCGLIRVKLSVLTALVNHDFHPRMPTWLYTFMLYFVKQISIQWFLMRSSNSLLNQSCDSHCGSPKNLRHSSNHPTFPTRLFRKPPKKEQESEIKS